MSMLAAMGDYFVWWQVPMVGALVVLLIFWKIYKNKQM